MMENKYKFALFGWRKTKKKNKREK